MAPRRIPSMTSPPPRFWVRHSLRELTPEECDALIEAQVRAGLVTRMAVLYDLLVGAPAPVPVGDPVGVA